MAQEYSNPKRSGDPYALPDMEVWQDRVYVSACCNTEVSEGYATATDEVPCPSCDDTAEWTRTEKTGWFYWFCFPGCLPDSSEFGPYATKAEALADARDNYGDDETDDEEDSDNVE